MRVLMVPPVSMTIPTHGYGGTQRVVCWLSEGLSALHHQPLLFAPKGSKADYLDILQSSYKPKPDAKKSFYVKYFADLKKKIPDGDFDVIHGQGHWIDYLRPFYPEKPLISTIHGIGEPIPQADRVVYVSAAQKKNYGETTGEVIYNPIKVEDYRPCFHKSDYLAFMAKLDWELKGLDTAIRISKKTGLKLKIAGPGMNRKILRTMNRNMQYLGVIGGAQKNEFLSRARVFLHPCRLPESFGLAVVEANACGTPVIALNNGSMPEVIHHEVTGFVCSCEDEMIASIDRITTIHPKDCVEWVQHKFSHIKIAEDYAALYASALHR